MHKFIKLFIVSLLVGITIANAQNSTSLHFCGMDIIPFESQLNGFVIEEISGIEYSGSGNQYFLIPQSKKRAHLILCSIDLNNGIKVTLDSIIMLPVDALEGESIRLNPKDNNIYIAEEGKDKSYIYKWEENKLVNVHKSKGKQRKNRGYEGLCFDNKGTMYIGLERPLKGDVTEITRISPDGKKKVFTYSLDVLDKDKKKDNGVTELLSLNDSTLLVVERAYLGGDSGNNVRVYQTRIPEKGNTLIKEKLLTNFADAPKIDNIEGVALSPSGKELIFVTDNNGNPKQQTQFICMKIE